MYKKILIMGIITVSVTILNVGMLLADGPVKGFCLVVDIVMIPDANSGEACDGGQLKLQDNGEPTMRVGISCEYNSTLKDINQYHYILVNKNEDNWEDLYLLFQTAYLTEEDNGLFIQLKEGTVSACNGENNRPVWDAADQIDRITLIKWSTLS